jgi:hypothetical protein
MADGMLSLNEVMQFLDLDKEGVEKLVQEDKLTAYKIGGVYLRFRKDQVMDAKAELSIRKRKKSYVRERIADFWDFNNFYILTGTCLIFILYLVLR